MQYLLNSTIIPEKKPAAYHSSGRISGISFSLLFHFHRLLKARLLREQLLILFQLCLRNFKDSFLIDAFNCVLPDAVQLFRLDGDVLQFLSSGKCILTDLFDSGSDGDLLKFRVPPECIRRDCGNLIFAIFEPDISRRQESLSSRSYHLLRL